MKFIPFKSLYAKGITYSRQHVYRLIAKNEFPKPVHFSGAGSRMAFVEAEIDAWLESKIVERDTVRAQT